MNLLTTHKQSDQELKIVSGVSGAQCEPFVQLTLADKQAALFTAEQAMAFADAVRDSAHVAAIESGLFLFFRDHFRVNSEEAARMVRTFRSFLQNEKDNIPTMPESALRFQCPTCFKIFRGSELVGEGPFPTGIAGKCPSCNSNVENIDAAIKA